MLVPISMVIATYNRLNSLIDTLGSLKYVTCAPSEIIIIDQSSNWEQNKKAVLQLFEKENYNIIYETYSPPSSTASRNYGIELAQNEIIAFSDDDVTYSKDLFTTIYNKFSCNKYGLIGALDKNAVPNGNFFPYLFAMRSFAKRNIGHVTKSVFGRYPDFNKIKCETPTNWAMGYFFVVRKDILTNYNIRFDEKLSEYAYAEDLDFSYRYCKQSQISGMKCILDPQIFVSHNCSKEWRTSSKKQTFSFILNRYYILKKIFPYDSEIQFWLSNLGFLLKKILKNDNVNDYIIALILCLKNRKKISQGIFPI